MRRDTIFYQIFQRYPLLFFELIGQHPNTVGRYEFTSVEVKEPTFRIDGVLLPPSDATKRYRFLNSLLHEPKANSNHSHR